MAIRTITAPGVEIREIDKSGYTTVPTGTAVYLKGFTGKGEPYRPMEITTRSAYEQIYGAPDTEAERYTYAAACETLNQGGRLWMARLPYDNEAFEKMAGIKYTVSEVADLSSESTFSELQQLSGLARMQKAYKITGAKNPALYNLSAIDAYREDEEKVPADTFLIVDTTGATYGRVMEDSRKGEERDLIGIVPVVTTAANALYVQSMLDVNLSNIHNYESLKQEKLQTLKTSSGYMNDGLLSSDVVVRYSTEGYFNILSDALQLSTTFVAEWSEALSSAAAALAQAEEDKGTYAAGIQAILKDKFIDGSVSCVECVLDESTAEEEILPDEIVTIDDIRKNTKMILDYYGKTMDLATIGQVAIAVFYVCEQYGDGDVPTGFPADWTINTLKDEILSWFERHTANKPIWNVILRFRVKTYNDTYADTTVPVTQSLDASGYFPTVQMADGGESIDTEHLKDVGVVVYKMYSDPTEGGKVSYEAVEAYAGSLYKDDKNPTTGVTKFLDTIINSQSNYINFFSNCFNKKLSKQKYLEETDILLVEPKIGASLGFYSSMTKKDISISKSILDGMNKCFEKVEDVNKLDIDIVPDAGLANIASYIKAIWGDKGPYDLAITDDVGNSLLGMWTCKKAADAHVKMWKTVEMKHDNFCKNIRKDCMFIADGLRPLVIQGQKKKIRDSKPTNTVDKDILPYVPAICGLNTSYGAGYIDWFEQADDYTGDFFWCPPSIKATGIYINTDLNYDYWLAPAGLNRGVIAATDVAFSPNGKQAGSIYEKNWNYAINYPQDGIVLEGQKTFQTKPTALDRVNVRRTMLRLERQVYKTIRYFVYENNTAYTRQRVVDAIEPIMKACWKSGNGGINRYKIVCDDKINDANTIDNNELKVQIGIVPNKSAEFILVDFILGNQSSTWAELLG